MLGTRSRRMVCRHRITAATRHPPRPRRRWCRDRVSLPRQEHAHATDQAAHEPRAGRASHLPTPGTESGRARAICAVHRRHRRLDHAAVRRLTRERSEPLSIVDYLYLAQLPPLLFAADAWQDARRRLGDAPDVKQRLQSTLDRIAPVRNEIAHVREVNRDRLLRASVACADVLEMLRGRI